MEHRGLLMSELLRLLLVMQKFYGLTHILHGMGSIVERMRVPEDRRCSR